MSSNITMVGRLTAPPELRFAKSGTPWATFSIAVTRGRDDDKETSFFDCKCFGALAENISEIPKGTRIISDGYLVQEKWETKEGQKRSKAVFMVNDAGPQYGSNQLSVTALLLNEKTRKQFKLSKKRSLERSPSSDDGE